MDLRPYQIEAINAAREQIRAGKKRVLINMPTGGGKTVVASSIIESASRMGSRTLFLAHRRELIEQTADKLMRFGVQPGILMGGSRAALHRPVQVASVQALAKRPNAFNQVDLVFVDEAHHVTTENLYAKLLGWWPNAKVIGLTATPWRLDGAGLADVFDGFVLACTPRQLRDDGYLVPVGGWEYAPISTRSARVSGGDFNAKDLEAASMSAKLFGEIIGEYKRHADGARAVLFACTINHSMAMAQAFRDAGVPAEHLDGETPLELRQQILARIKSGATKVLCNVNVATEGWDCPELECAILARPTLSTSLALQMIGRVLRPCEGKTVARLHDHARILASHGHPYADRDWSPQKTVKVNRREQEGGVTRARHCAACKAVIAVYPCDACKWAPGPAELPEIVAAERRAITDTPAWRKTVAAEQKRAAEAAAWKLKSREEKRQIYLALVAKYGPRRALGAYRGMSGETEWPPREWRPPENQGEAMRWLGDGA